MVLSMTYIGAGRLNVWDLHMYRETFSLLPILVQEDNQSVTYTFAGRLFGVKLSMTYICAGRLHVRDLHLYRKTFSL